jgi:di/tricarboxylate transporter
MLPILCVLGLLLAVVLSVVSRLNVGLLGLLLALSLGAGVGGLRLREVAALFPSHLFIMLVGLTLLFGQARQNGSLDRLTGWAVQLARGNVGLIPVVFFLLAAALSTAGAGNIGAVALLSPVAMAVAGELKIPAFLMALCVACGGSAAALSPLSPTGVVAKSLMARGGLPGQELQAYANVLVAHTLIGLGGYFLLGGAALCRRGSGPEAAGRLAGLLATLRAPLSWKHALTLLVITAVLLGVTLFGADVGLCALAGAVLLTLTRAADEEQAMRAIPWGAIVMVCGMMTFMALLERSGGIELWTRLLSRLATPRTVPLVNGLLCGAISAYASSVGVVLPAFLPTAPGLAQQFGVDPMAVASSINVGAHLVDVSPLSTLGALCLSHAAAGEDTRALFRKLLLWGMSMAVVGALYCEVVFGLLGLARWS